MEEGSREFASISFSAQMFEGVMNSLEKSLSYFSSLSSDPLFSAIFTLYALVFLYFPALFTGIVFSPVLICTGVLLLALLRHGAVQRFDRRLNSPPEPASHDSPGEEGRECVSGSDQTSLEPKMELDLGPGLDPDPYPLYSKCFVEWDVRAPLEVIYEEYEGEEDEEEEEDVNDDVFEQKEEKRVVGIDRYPSLSMYFPETDSGSSSDEDFPGIGDWDSSGNICFSWEEDEKEELIEIALDGKKNITEVFRIEEDNLIEIDISPRGNSQFTGERW